MDIITLKTEHLQELRPNVDPSLFLADKGPALALRDQRGILAAGGLHLGIAEAWMVCHERFLQESRRTVLCSVRNILRQMVQETNVWQVFAVRQFDNAFLRHMGFLPVDNIMVTGIIHG